MFFKSFYYVNTFSNVIFVKTWTVNNIYAMHGFKLKNLSVIAEVCGMGRDRSEASERRHMDFQS